MVEADVIPAAVEPSKAGLGVIAARNISRGETIGAYYGVHEYTYRLKKVLSIIEYSEQTMTVLISTINLCSIGLPNVATECHSIEHLGWIVAAQFCAMGYTNDLR